ncbi:MAG: hypothetical protein ACRYGA_12670 [Janthinobacterium lividum]
MLKEFRRQAEREESAEPFPRARAQIAVPVGFETAACSVFRMIGVTHRRNASSRADRDDRPNGLNGLNGLNGRIDQ